MKDPVIFIAGGKWQKPFLKYLKDKGHHVTVVNPVVTETTKLADAHIVTDVNDVETISYHVGKIGPKFVTSDQSDISTRVVAALNFKHRLPGLYAGAVIDRFSDKYVMYEMAKTARVPVPETAFVVVASDLREFADRVGFPVIIKPVDATMSRGFQKFDGPEEITEEAVAYSTKFSRRRLVIAQKFVDGDMVTLEGAASGWKHRTLAASVKDGYFKPGINTGVRYPCTISPDVLDRIIKSNDAYVEMSGMNFGLTHSEYIVSGDDFWFIEIGARGGGAGIIDKIVPWVSGINPYDILYKSLMGELVDIKSLKLLSRHALLKYYQKEDVFWCDWETAEFIQGIPGVADFQYDFIGQQYVRDANDTRHTMGIYLGETAEEVDRVAASVLSALSPTDGRPLPGLSAGV